MSKDPSMGTGGWFDDWKKHGRRNVEHLSKETLDAIDRYDRIDRDRIRKEMNDYKVSQDNLENVIDTGGQLFDDSFWAFLKADPRLRDKGEMRPSHLINRHVMDEAMELPEYERLRAWTEGDVVSSGMAAVTLEPELETLADRVKKHQEEAARVEQMMQDLAEAERDLDEMMNDMMAEPDPQAIADQQAMIDKMMAGLEAAGNQLDQNAKDAAAGMAQSMRSALNKAADEQEEMQTAAQAWGMEKGQVQKMDPAQRIALAKKLNTPKFKRMAEIWGPMQRVANNEQTRKIYHSNEEVYDLGIGNDLSRVLMSELNAIHHPLLKYDFFRKFTERELLQYEMQGTEKVGKGGIIMAMDNSGSMSGDPEVWAKAIGLCALNIAKEQKRSFTGIHFASRGQIAVFDFTKPGEATVDEVIAYAEHFFSGGTDFETPLNKCVELLQKEFDAKGFVEGDVVFITDGICGVRDEWLTEFVRKREELGFKVHGIMIGASADLEPFKTICDGNGITVRDMLSGEDVRGVFRAL